MSTELNIILAIFASAGTAFIVNYWNNSYSTKRANERIDDILKAQDAMKKEILSLQKDNNKAKIQFSEYSSEIKQIHKDIEYVKGDIESIKGELSNVNTELGNSNRTLTQINTGMEILLKKT